MNCTDPFSPAPEIKLIYLPVTIIVFAPVIAIVIP
jgi:hypothetical protein